MRRATVLFLCGMMLLSCRPVWAATVFVEAEDFVVTGNGWRPVGKESSETRPASRVRTLWGADGAGDSTASMRINVPTDGTYRLWVRYLESPWRGPFHVAVLQNDQEIGGQDFDLEAKQGVQPWSYLWESIDNLKLSTGAVVLRLSKYKNQNCSGYSRHVDCMALTDDQKLVPNHIDFGPQTWLRVTLGNLYEKPVYVHIFADHFHAPWYAHYAISKAGLEEALAPSKPEYFLHGGESTGWVNITHMVYQDSGVIMVTSVRENYWTFPPRLKAKFEFATAPEDQAIVKTFEREAEPNAINIIVPPDFAKPENLPNLAMDLDIAEATGKIADSVKWPAVGKKPTLFPFFVCESINGWLKHDERVADREWRTLDHYGFSNREKEMIGGVWYMKNECYSQPDLAKMKEAAKNAVAEFRKNGKKAESIVYCMLMDEPGGQDPAHLAGCSACTEQFREWLKEVGKTPADLLVADWNEVKPVENAQAEASPALYYYTQKFRTRALSKFMRVQREVLHQAYGTTFPVNVNFSDGATYYANFYGQGVDYFELLDSEDQNAIWSENWGNGAASRQCTTYNVELMRSAATKRSQHLGQYLIAYAGRLPWDVKLNTVSQAARDIKAFNNFWYGPSWSGHEGGPPWSCSAWYSKPETWYSNAEVVREVGGAEDLLSPARKVKSQVALLYSSSTDVWTLSKNYAFGFDRMFLWLALAHAQIPVDFISEKMVEENGLQGYKVCYLCGPNITGACAEKLKAWVKDGGTLMMTAGAGMRDEYNRAITLLEEVVPADRAKPEEPQAYLNSGSYLYILKPKDTVTIAGNKALMEVLSLKQALTPKPQSQVLGTFKDGAPALIVGRAGKGRVYCAGFLPGLAYMQPAILSRNKLQEEIDKAGKKGTGIPDPSSVAPDEALLRRSHCPWDYPNGIRNVITLPVRDAKVNLPVECSVPLVDAVLMESPRGAVVPLANYTLQPQKKLVLTVQTAKPVRRVMSVHHGKVPFEKIATNRVRFSLPLRETDFIKLYY